jgi:hypothetical protein
METPGMWVNMSWNRIRTISRLLVLCAFRDSLRKLEPGSRDIRIGSCSSFNHNLNTSFMSSFNAIDVWHSSRLGVCPSYHLNWMHCVDHPAIQVCDFPFMPNDKETLSKGFLKLQPGKCEPKLWAITFSVLCAVNFLPSVKVVWEIEPMRAMRESTNNFLRCRKEACSVLDGRFSILSQKSVISPSLWLRIRWEQWNKNEISVQQISPVISAIVVSRDATSNETVKYI